MTPIPEDINKILNRRKGRTGAGDTYQAKACDNSPKQLFCEEKCGSNLIIEQSEKNITKGSPSLKAKWVIVSVFGRMASHVVEVIEMIQNVIQFIANGVFYGQIVDKLSILSQTISYSDDVEVKQSVLNFTVCCSKDRFQVIITFLEGSLFV